MCILRHWFGLSAGRDGAAAGWRSPESRHNDDGPRDDNDDVTSTDAPTEGDASTRRSYLEALFQGHSAKNDLSMEVLRDFCTRETFLRSVPVSSAHSL
jgi:hypothetical protein